MCTNHQNQIGSAINLAARSYFHRSHSITLDHLKLVFGLCITHIDWSLPTISLIFLLLFVLSTSVPAILWTGALTPVLTTTNTTYNLPLPAFSNWTGFSAGNDITSALVDMSHSNYTTNNAQGTFTWMPEFDLPGSILQVARDASNRSDMNAGLRTHPKLDRSGFVYTARSYGIGAAVALTDGFNPETGNIFGVPITGYEYVEQGLFSDAVCTYNQTSEFSLYPVITPNLSEDSSIFVFDANGLLPNGATPWHTAASYRAEAVVSLGAGVGKDESEQTDFLTQYMALATGSGDNSSYGRLDKIQCKIQFQPKAFSVMVNTTLKTITVKPHNTTITHPPYTHNLTANVMQSLDFIGGVFSSTLYFSIIGDTFLSNIANIDARPNMDRDNATFLGVKDALESMLDNFLLAFSSAQLEVYQDSTDSPARAFVRAIIFGKRRDIYAIFVVNVLIGIIYISALVYISPSGAGKFNFTDIKSVIISASAGGNTIAERAQKLHLNRGSRWTAKESDKTVGQMSVRFVQYKRGSSKGGVAVLLANQGQEPDETEENENGAVMLTRFDTHSSDRLVVKSLTGHSAS